ncbi:cysteine protease ATG4C-like [Stegodyphus dumicola]|uniref:cysteine protease ATG4C-like n=1 Tax=Stegodyphus dumicola TaxID=202533 RepID=UPI0015B03F7F|nr:cysteine protease ATG4C-like [Stegodyphus dumicola]
MSRLSSPDAQNFFPKALHLDVDERLNSWILDDIQDLDLDDTQSRNVPTVKNMPESNDSKCPEESWTFPDLNVCDIKDKKSSYVNDVFHSDIPYPNELTYKDCKTGKQSVWHISNEPDSSLYPRITKSNNSSLLFCDKSKHSSDESSHVNNKSKPCSSNSWSIGQLINKRQNDSIFEESNVGKETVPAKIEGSPTFVFKKRNALPSSTNSSDQIQVKTKLRSMWNNMKYGWRVKREVNLKTDSAIWLLGKCYHNKLNEGMLLPQDVANQLKLDLLSKIWLTYRINFPAIPGTDLVSDTGWGCMLRCGQMMMAQALVCHFLHRDWRVSLDQSAEQKKLYKMILRWFGDSLSENSPFSLHHLVSLGESYGRKAGDWYGPTHAAHALRDALTISKVEHPQLRDICMYVASDGIVFKQDVIDLCQVATEWSAANSDLPEENGTSAYLNYELPKKTVGYQRIDPVLNIEKKEMKIDSTRRNILYPCLEDEKVFSTPSSLPRSSLYPSLEIDQMSFTDMCPSYSEFGPPSFNSAHANWRSLILFVSVRLGNDKINPFYIPCLKSLLAYEHCIGIIGGRPKHALYFIGWQDDKLIHMDPHSCQPAVDVDKDDFNEKSFHSSSIRTMSFMEMDPSCAIGFYFRKKEDFDHFVTKFSEITAPLKKNLDYPVFALADGKRSEIEEVDAQRIHERSSFSHSNNKSLDEVDEDYILL